MKHLGELLQDRRSLSLAGMCKNAGKTTVLNAIIEELNRSGLGMGLTSIGRDGESSDLVTGTAKPGIYIQEGTLFATAADLLSACDVTKEIMMQTQIPTPMGEVLILKARSDGFIQLAGPSTNQQLTLISSMMKELGAQKMIIDGAISRKSLCSPKVAKTTLLCSGASYDRDLNQVVEDTAFSAGILQLPATSLIPQGRGRYQLYDQNQNWMENEEESLGDLLADPANQSYQTVLLEGAVTDALIKPLLMSNLTLKDKVFVAEDSSKILMSRNFYEKFCKKGGRMEVLSTTDLLAVTINPFSAYGNHFDKDLYLEKMQQRVSCPVYNVLEEIR